MENTLYFSKNLKHLRRQNQRQTQDALALVLGLTRSVISSYEDGRAEPNISTLTKISEYFGVSIENLTNLDLVNVDEKEIEHKRELSQYASGRRLRLVSVKSVSSLGKQVSLVPQKASAGYTRGFGDDKYLQNLPHYQLPFLEKAANTAPLKSVEILCCPCPTKASSSENGWKNLKRFATGILISW
ncbi:MAG: helix-turn-helix transcriptional regulator [Microscillaceae bacterium]|nr:helix-turn-helix transcriptional regulator [Microscillaceae bacterium]